MNAALRLKRVRAYAEDVVEVLELVAEARANKGARKMIEAFILTVRVSDLVW